ncbi:MAG: flotillin family protein, partial [bacterium]|nr:flotillin family protein [bacterium]
GGMLASFDSMIVLPVLHRLEVMDITQIIIKVERVGSDAVVFKGNVLADVKVSFYVRVNDSVDSALKAAQTLGGSRVSDEQELFKVFSPKFSESLTAAAKDLELSARDGFKRKIRGVVDTNLNGFIIDDVVVDYLEQRASE